MLYYLGLNESEFPIRVLGSEGAERYRLEAPSGPLTACVLSRSEHGRPALVLVDGCVYRVRAATRHKGVAVRDAERTSINGQQVRMTLETELERRARPNRNSTASSPSQVTAPMPGRVVKVNVREGDVVAAGDPLLGIEAMKMENELLAPNAGRISRVTVSIGATVEADQELVLIDPL